MGISGLLLLVAFTFTASSIRNTRFSDATKSLENYIKDQYIRVQTNSLALNMPDGRRPVCSSSGSIQTVDSTAGTGTSQTCVLLGAVLEFSPVVGQSRNTISVKPVLGYGLVSNRPLGEVNPQVWSESSESYQLPWQSEIVTARAFRTTTPPAITNNVNRLIILRDTTSERINFYMVNVGSGPFNLTNIVTATQGATRNLPTLICIRSDDGGGLRGAVRINGTGRESGLNIGSVTSSVVSTGEIFFGEHAGGFGCT